MSKTVLERPYVTYERATQTLRQWPGNYLVAHIESNVNWVCEPDIAIDKVVGVITFNALLKYERKYQVKDGYQLAAYVNGKLKSRFLYWILKTILHSI